MLRERRLPRQSRARNARRLRMRVPARDTHRRVIAARSSRPTDARLLHQSARRITAHARRHRRVMLMGGALRATESVVTPRAAIRNAAMYRDATTRRAVGGSATDAAGFRVWVNLFRA